MTSFTSKVARRLPRPGGGSSAAVNESAGVANPVGSDGIPGRLMQVLTDAPRAARPAEIEGTDPTEAAAVRAGWLLLDAHERLSKRGAERVFGHETDAWHDYAADTIGELTYTLSNGRELVPENKKNRLRFRRTLDFARDGEVVFDVGFGRGLLAAQLIKDRGVKAYYGIDIVDRYVPIATDLFHVNGLSPGSLNLEVGDLYDLTTEHIAASGATLVICCEVLEHVPDAELALKTLAEALPEGVDLLFSVPMHGRIEGEWGHVSVFDVSRLKSMLEGAGLYAHHVEPLANVWSLVVASRDPGPSRRVREATGRPAESVSVPLSQHQDFVYLDPGDLAASGGATVVTKTAQAVAWRFATDQGMTFAVSGLEALRFRFHAKDAAHLTQLTAVAYAGDQVVARWTWKVKPGELADSATLSTSMRPGAVGAQFVGGRHDGCTRADRVELLGTVAGNNTVELNVRVAYLP
ncbi:MAG: class I SAM-dependent methyltransferase [Aeromicrobium sp.]